MADCASSQDKGGSWPFRRGDSSIKTHNLFHGSPSHSNKHGQYFEAGADEYDQLGNLDISVSFVNITSGSMTVPYYNSRSTRVVVVVKGSGWSQMACPHLGQKQRGGESGGEHGKNNIYRKMDKEEMEVSFNLPAEQVKKIFDGAGTPISWRDRSKAKREEGMEGPWIPFWNGPWGCIKLLSYESWFCV